MVSPGGATTYPVRFKLEVDDSALRQAVVNSRAFIETNVARRTSGDLQMSMGRQMVSDYSDRAMGRAFSPVNQTMQSLFSGIGDSAPGGASWTNRTSMMTSNLNMQLNRVFQPGSIMPQGSYIQNVLLGGTANPNEGNAAYGARSQMIGAIAGMPTTSFSGDQSAAGMMRAANSVHYDYDYQAKYAQGTIAEMTRMGMMGGIQNRTQMMELFKSAQGAQSMMMAMGLDPTQSATMLGNLVNYGGPGSLKSGVEGYMLAKTTGANMGQLENSMAAQSSANAANQRFGASSLSVSVGKVAENAALASVVAQGASTMIDPTTKKPFFSSPEVEANITTSMNNLFRARPETTQDEAIDYAIQTNYGAMEYKDRERLKVLTRNNITANRVQNKIDTSNMEAQKQMEEGFSVGAMVRAFREGTHPAPTAANEPVGTSTFTGGLIERSMSADKVDLNQSVINDRNLVATSPGGIDMKTALENPGMAMRKMTQGLLSGGRAAGDAWDKSDGFFSGAWNAVSAGYTAERDAMFGKPEANEARMRLKKYDQENEKRMKGLSRGLTSAVGKIGAGASEDEIFAAASLLSRKRAGVDMTSGIAAAGGEDAATVKLFHKMENTKEADQVKVMGALKPLNEAKVREASEKAIPNVLKLISGQMQEENAAGNTSEVNKRLLAGAIDKNGAPRVEVLRKNFDEMQKDPAMREQINARVNTAFKEGGYQSAGPQGDSKGTEGTLAGSDKELFKGAAKNLTDAAAKLNQLSLGAANPNKGAR